jgi:hypothetical protein
VREYTNPALSLQKNEILNMQPSSLEVRIFKSVQPIEGCSAAGSCERAVAHLPHDFGTSVQRQQQNPFIVNHPEFFEIWNHRSGYFVI